MIPPAQSEAPAFAEAGPAAPAAQPGAVDLQQPALYVNRETSWLAFNARVLAEASHPRWPLLERLKFLAISASNLDEFFMIRISGLHEQLENQTIGDPASDGRSAREQLDLVIPLIRNHLRAAATVLSGDLLPALAAAGIHIRNWRDLDAGTAHLARQYFRRAVFPVVTPLAVDPGHPFPFVSNLSLSLAVEARDPDTKERKFARVKVPEILPRFVSLGELDPARATQAQGQASHEFLPLEQLISANLDDLFPGMEILGCSMFRVTRDMDMEIPGQDSNDLLSIVDREIRKRRFGACVRLEIDATVPERVRHLLVDELEIDDEDVYQSEGLLGLSALMQLTGLNRPELRDPPFVPRALVELPEGADLFDVVRARDLLLHHPYESFVPVLEFLRRAAEDPRVLAIKMTLYRAGSNAEAVKPLMRAAENGKQVAVSIEIKARFDEEKNILWARELERVGAHVFYGHVISKTHAKVALVVRQEDDGLRRYVHLSTGNYNAGTARLYSDIGLLTADPQIGEDVSELFNSLSGFSKQARYRKLAVAPTTLSDTLLAKIEAQAARARAGKPARIFAKMNALVEAPIIQALYRASMAGAPVDLCIRGVCCLRPGVPGVSENIRVFSIVGRFLEHERVFLFGPPEQEEWFLSSADWMPRNLHRRVEALFPVEAPELRARIRHEVVEPALAPDNGAYDMDVQGDYRQRLPQDGAEPRLAQVEVMERVMRRSLHLVTGRGAAGHGAEQGGGVADRRAGQKGKGGRKEKK